MTREASYADRAWQLAFSRGFERDFIRAARLQGFAALGRGELDNARNRLRHALDRSRAVNFADGELWSLIGFAELNRQLGEVEIAREFLSQVWGLAERGPYPIHHAEAWNIMAEIAGDCGDMSAAIDAATKAYQFAWCDGPDFAYKWGLEKAGAHLKCFGAPVPEVVAPDQVGSEDMPKVDIGLGKLL
jgi:tetratricopeptide (TPR) repeat protein